MNKSDWIKEWQRLQHEPIAPRLIASGFNSANLEQLPYSTLGDLSGLSSLEWLSGSLETLGYQDRDRLRYLAQKMRYLPVIAQYALNNEWDEFVTRVQAVYEVMPEAFSFFYTDVPEEKRHDFAIGCYVHHGDAIPQVRKAIARLPPRGRVDLPSDYSAMDEITIYRAGEEPIKEAANRISWTLSEDVARFFLEKWNGRHAKYLFRGKIETAKVIGYTDERDEQEVLQHQSVYNVELLESLGE